MNVAQVTAEILRREGVEVLLTYPLNPLTETAAEADIRPIVVRQERVGVHMADCLSRMSSGDKVGVFCCQLGPGIENAFGAVAQAYSEAVPLVVIPGGYPRTQHLREAELQLLAELPARDQACGDDHRAGADRAGAAPRLHLRAQWPARPGDAGDSA